MMASLLNMFRCPMNRLANKLNMFRCVNMLANLLNMFRYLDRLVHTLNMFICLKNRLANTEQARPRTGTSCSGRGTSWAHDRNKLFRSRNKIGPGPEQVVPVAEQDRPRSGTSCYGRGTSCSGVETS